MDYKELIEQLQRLSRTRDALIHTGVSYACADAATAIETLLAEREAAVKHGKWIEFRIGINNRYVCSACNFENILTPFGKYCQNCGAKMDLQIGPTPPDRERTEG